MLFIDLTERTARNDGHYAVVRVNADAITRISEAARSMDGGTRISFENSYVHVQESPDRVLALIDQARHA